MSDIAPPLSAFQADIRPQDALRAARCISTNTAGSGGNANLMTIDAGGG